MRKQQAETLMVVEDRAVDIARRGFSMGEGLRWYQYGLGVEMGLIVRDEADLPAFANEVAAWTHPDGVAEAKPEAGGVNEEPGEAFSDQLLALAEVATSVSKEPKRRPRFAGAVAVSSEVSVDREAVMAERRKKREAAVSTAPSSPVRRSRHAVPATPLSPHVLRGAAGL